MQIDKKETVLASSIPGPFKVRLAAEGNPDNREPKSLGIPVGHIKVDTLKQATQRCRDFINEYELGSGNWAGGQVYNMKGKQIAEVSYNGRVWMPGEFPTPEIILEEEK